MITWICSCGEVLKQRKNTGWSNLKSRASLQHRDNLKGKKTKQTKIELSRAKACLVLRHLSRMQSSPRITLQNSNSIQIEMLAGIPPFFYLSLRRWLIDETVKKKCRTLIPLLSIWQTRANIIAYPDFQSEVKAVSFEKVPFTISKLCLELKGHQYLQQLRNLSIPVHHRHEFDINCTQLEDKHNGLM